MTVSSYFISGKSGEEPAHYYFFHGKMCAWFSSTIHSTVSRGLDRQDFIYKEEPQPPDMMGLSTSLEWWDRGGTIGNTIKYDINSSNSYDAVWHHNNIS